MRVGATRSPLILVSWSTTTAHAQSNDGESESFWSEVCALYPGPDDGSSAICDWAHRQSNPERMYLGSPLTEPLNVYIDLRELVDGFDGGTAIDIYRDQRDLGRAYFEVPSPNEQGGIHGLVLEVDSRQRPYSYDDLDSWYPTYKVALGLYVRRYADGRRGEQILRRLFWGMGDQRGEDATEELRWRFGYPRRVPTYTSREVQIVAESLLKCLSGDVGLLRDLRDDHRKYLQGRRTRNMVLPEGWCGGDPLRMSEAFLP